MALIWRSAWLDGAAVALSLGLLAGCQARTDASGRTVLTTPTLGQVLGVTSAPGMQPTSIAASGSVRDQRVIADHTIQVVASRNGHQIVVDGRVLVVNTEDDRLIIQGAHQGGGRTYVVVEEQSGGNACPSQYQVIDLSGSAPIVPPKIGNCSDIPKIAVVGGALRVSVPAFRAAPAAIYAFRDGRLSR